MKGTRDSLSEIGQPLDVHPHEHETSCAVRLLANSTHNPVGFVLATQGSRSEFVHPSPFRRTRCYVNRSSLLVKRWA
jgi:hypothetical protein